MSAGHYRFGCVGSLVFLVLFVAVAVADARQAWRNWNYSPSVIAVQADDGSWLTGPALRAHQQRLAMFDLAWGAYSLMVAVFNGFAARWSYIRWRRIESHQCVACGYSLMGLPVPRCPECGREFDPQVHSQLIAAPSNSAEASTR